MPLYDYECGVCGREWEAFHMVATRYTEKCCGTKAGIVIGKSELRVNAYDYYDDQIGEVITSPGQRDRVMKKKGLAVAEKSLHKIGNGKPSMRITYDGTKLHTQHL